MTNVANAVRGARASQTDRERALRVLHRWHRRALALLEFPQEDRTRELLEWMLEDIEQLGVELTPVSLVAERQRS